MIKNKYSEILKNPFFIAGLVVISVIVLGAFRIMHYMKSSDVLLLTDRAGAQWIKYDSEFQLEAKPASKTQCRFKYVFNTSKKISNARIAVQALKRYEIFFDGINIFSSADEFDHWKKTHDIAVPFAVNAGSHEILIIVTSENSYPAVIAYSDILPVRTGSGWFASTDGKNWKIAVPASRIKQAEVSKIFPSSVSALIAISPYLAIVFIMMFLISMFGSFYEDKVQKIIKWRLEPSYIRWGLLFLWAILSINNMFKLNFQVGTDGWGHIQYIDYIVTKGSLPLASDGWQMYQAPLNYILSAPLYAFLIKWIDFPSVVKTMGIIPVISGLLQIEIVYRIARLVFAQRKDLQIIATVAGSLLPIHTYACQSVGNEPLAACFISLLILLSVSLVMPDQRERKTGYFVLMGLVWGLALLSKMTAVPFALVLIIVLIFHANLVQATLKLTLKPIIITFCVSMLIAGWYYFRNYIALGNPFAGILEHSQMLQWWQDPGYRTWSQIMSFGQSFDYPVYAGVTSFWDMFYSTLWLDGLNSGLIDFMPWNQNFMIAGALLALLPSIFILAGVASIWLNKEAFHRNAVILSAGTITLFLVVMINIYIIRPVYSGTKASYTLGLLPCYAILIAAGAEPFFRNKIIRSVVIALFFCWAFAAYAAYFVVHFQ
ncbi:MAG: glycosyltransferase family 39 protein [Deltaproteobacteria bacterium]|nr:glycosyltransferase family 39 protein [Deltaproteobacteria bacterium]